MLAHFGMVLVAFPLTNGPTSSHAWRCRSSVEASSVCQRICDRTAASLLSLRGGQGLKQVAGTPLALLRRASGSFAWFIHGCQSRRCLLVHRFASPSVAGCPGPQKRTATAA